ncbi:MAG TPA: head GIN domain-containing protein [Anaerolineaceae bacterium]|nr:head GIN domain-containing protein [Anaerolineaceae bacterium]
MSEQFSNQEKRDVSGFSALVFRGMGRIDLLQGDHEELVIEAQPEIRSRIKTEVREGTLYIDYDEDWRDWTGIRSLSGDKIVFKLTMREINAISVSGVGSLDTPRIETSSLTLAITGPGLLTVGTLKTSTLAVNLSGVGAIDLAGQTDEMTVTLSGAGSFKAARLEAGKASVRLSGVGTVSVWAKNSLETSISGAGVIEYYGSPQLSRSNTGLGVLKFMGSR